MKSAVCNAGICGDEPLMQIRLASRNTTDSELEHIRPGEGSVFSLSYPSLKVLRRFGSILSWPSIIAPSFPYPWIPGRAEPGFLATTAAIAFCLGALGDPLSLR